MTATFNTVDVHQQADVDPGLVISREQGHFGLGLWVVLLHDNGSADSTVPSASKWTMPIRRTTLQSDSNKQPVSRRNAFLF